MAALVPVPALKHALVLALVVVLAMMHTVLCASSSNHTNFSLVARNGSVPSLSSYGKGEELADGRAPAPLGSLEGCGCASAPWDFENQKLATLYLVIQAFKRAITCYPLRVTASWVGTKLYNSATGAGMYKGFYCDFPPDAPTTRTIASIDLFIR